MPYAMNWISSEPVGSSLPAGQLDDQIRYTKLGVEERMDVIIGNNNWSTNTFPIIDGTSIRNLATLSSEMGSKPSINATLNFIPKKSSASAFTDSAMSDDGVTIDFGTRTTRFRGIPYNWPTSATPGLFLQYVAANGTMAWASAAAAGSIGGSGTINKIPLFSGTATIADSVISQSGATITIGGALAVNTTISGASISVTGAVSGASLTASGAINGATASLSTTVGAPQFDVGALVKLTANTAGSKKTLFLTDIVPSGGGTAFDINNTNAEYRIGGTKVVGARITGWGIPTGTATRTTFATDTVTLIELARRLKALVDDLTTHGVIGA